MSDRYTGTISILKEHIEKYPEVKEEVRLTFYDPDGKLYDDDCWDEESEIAEFKDVDARYGHFEELEDLLVKYKIPFDRWSAGYGSYDAETVFYRPNIKKEPIYADSNGEQEVSADKLRRMAKGLDLNTKEGIMKLGKKVKKLLDNMPEIPALATYATKS